MKELGQFVVEFRGASKYIHGWAKSKGFWAEDRNDGECIALMHSELSEALEALRHGNPLSEIDPSMSQLAEELADTIIRIMDFSYARGLDVGHAILMKMGYNEGRPYKHGKEF